jgi:uncharacterized repeat protein (TIGR03803 family)
MKPIDAFRKNGAAAALALLAGAALVPAAQAQNLAQYSLPDTPNGFAFGEPVQGRDGYLYGLMGNNNPSIYISTPGGSMTYQRVGPDTTQYICTTGMILGRDGNFYGTCNMVNGGTQDVAFRYTPGGSGAPGNFTMFAVIYTNANGDGSFPNALMQASDGNFYGTTTFGGTNGEGTVFRITPAGVITTLYNFTGGTNVAGPAQPGGPLIEAKDGKLYGTTQTGSTTLGDGTIYSMTLKGKVSVLYNFINLKGESSNPYDGVIQGSDGLFYGTASGGEYNNGYIYKLSAKGVLTDLHDVDYAVDGSLSPYFHLVQAPDGNFYGALNGCASGGCRNGLLYEITSTGSFTPLFTIVVPVGGCPDAFPGCIPNSGQIVHTNGALYGVTEQGGVNDEGVLYAETPNPALKPNVKLQEASGAVGSTVDIVGQGFTGATKVHFGKVAARFSVGSDTYMSATVPAGAASGFVVVTEPGAKLQSQAKFLVK